MHQEAVQVANKPKLFIDDAFAIEQQPRCATRMRPVTRTSRRAGCGNYPEQLQNIT
jgi:hypothetical protein